MKKKENGHCFEEVYLLEKLNLTDSNAIKVIPQCYLIYHFLNSIFQNFHEI